MLVALSSRPCKCTTAAARNLDLGLVDGVHPVNRGSIDVRVPRQPAHLTEQVRKDRRMQVAQARRSKEEGPSSHLVGCSRCRILVEAVRAATAALLSGIS